MNTVAIIDYKLCNLHSVASAVNRCGHKAFVTDRADEIRNATHIILPGVGSFSDAMKNIRELRIDEVLRELVLEEGYPLLGICLGMQLLATKGDEGGQTEGLGFIDATIDRLETSDPSERIPHIGWNEVNIVKDSLLLKDVPTGNDFYFVHSFAMNCNDADVVATTP
ncbi:MAG: imidazole glycerol phosphate synthase subunit HisH, partial [Candidatus Peribacteraceae bacterium]|nr:imidazole glycerol phosphate synthase subunit HisH [Candidatus Peribacteraceae bacterium]